MEESVYYGRKRLLWKKTEMVFRDFQDKKYLKNQPHF